MFNLFAAEVARLWGRPAFRVWGKARPEKKWHEVSVHATSTRDLDSPWPRPFFAGTAITWAGNVIALGEDFAVGVLKEQIAAPASRDHPVEVFGGRLRSVERRLAAGGSSFPSWSEVLAHECGHTWQARRYGWLYLPGGAIFTLFREGEGWVHHFENQASAEGLFGGIVTGSVRRDLMKRAMDD